MRAAIAILMTCALMLAPGSAIAEERADDRPYDVSVSEDRAEIEIPREVDGRTGESKVVLDTREGLLSGSFGFANATTADEQLDVRLHQLVEFRDANEDGQLDDEDEIASAWKLSNASRNVTAESNGTVAWRALEKTNVTSDNGVNGTRVHAVAEFPEQDPIAGVISQLGQGENRTITLNMTVYEAPAEVDGETVPTSRVHVAWTVDDYPYTSDDTRLALVAGGVGTGQLEVADQANRTKLANRGTQDAYGVEVAANVSDEAEVDGNATSVALTPLSADNGTESAEDEKLVSLAYERGDVIEHGLLLGASVSSSETSVIESASDQVSAVPSVGAVAAVGLLAAAAFVVKRR